MVQAILTELSKTSFDFRKFANTCDALSASFEEWVVYYQLKFCIARVLQPNSFLEVGVRYGYSARIFLEAAPSAKFAGINLDCDSFRWYYEKRYARLRTDAQQLAHSPGGANAGHWVIKILKEDSVDSQNLRPLSLVTPIRIFSVDDILIAGFPKSGNTWCQNLVAGILHNLDLANVPDLIIQELVPDVGYKRTYRRFSERMVLKTHETVRPDYRHVVLLVRDARDVMISYLDFDAALSGVAPDAIDFVDHVQRYGPPWCNHMVGWLNNLYNAHLMTIRYDDLSTDCVSKLPRLCSATIPPGCDGSSEAAPAFQFVSDRSRQH